MCMYCAITSFMSTITEMKRHNKDWQIYQHNSNQAFLLIKLNSFHYAIKDNLIRLNLILTIFDDKKEQ